MPTGNLRSAEPAKGEPRFEAELLPRLARIAFFRLATDLEIDRSYDAYVSGDYERLCDVWCDTAQPTRADLGKLTRVYDRARLAPSLSNGLVFLATLRAVLRAGVKFRSKLSARTQLSLQKDFPWLEKRHEHIPPGWTPSFKFPDEMRQFIDALPIENVRVRWQICTALNEVQQHWYSRHAAERFQVPALLQHAARERQLATNYFAHWAPPVTRELWRQCLIMLDALNAATFDMICNRERGAMLRHAAIGLVTRRGEWRQFVAALKTPQWLMEPSVY
jgi:hypothetical protein